MFKNALVSCSNKKGLVEFLKPLNENGLRIVSTGGTAKHLQKNGINVVEVSKQTGFPEIMDGRVKTLHPHIHMALLARENNQEDLNVLKQYEIQPFDLVIGNLYPFEEEPSIETIDVGGPSFLRAAAKSFERITVICDPDDYQWISQKTNLNQSERQMLAAKVFAHTSSYDAMIADHFGGHERLEFSDLGLGGRFVQSLRYGENPSQKAAWYRLRGHGPGLHEAIIHQGKELSYNNLLDLDAALSALLNISGPSPCLAVKHLNPCGVGTDQDPLKSVQKCVTADPKSIFGGIVALKFKVTAPIAEVLSSIFLECILAPEIDPSAMEIFSQKKNLRVLTWDRMMKNEDNIHFRTILGGFLLQTQDRIEDEWQDTWEVIGSSIKDEQKSDLLLAWQVAAHLKSNAIAIVEAGQTLGLGMGQVNRVDSVDQAIQRMREYHAQAKNPVLSSDAFFPFADSIERIAKAGIKYVIQPGGSVRDVEVKKRAQELGVNLVLTGQRHFLH